MCAAVSRTSWRRVRVSSRSACCSGGGTKLARTKPCASKSASHRASCTSLLRPGMLRTAAACASTSVSSVSKTAHTGFQYTPVDSSTACVQPSARTQSASASKAGAVVPNVRTSWRTPAPAAIRTHATTVFWCTSSPAHRA